MTTWVRNAVGILPHDRLYALICCAYAAEPLERMQQVYVLPD